MRNKIKVIYVYKNTTNLDKYSIIFSPKKINLKYHQLLGRMDDPMFKFNEVTEPFSIPVKKKVFKKKFKTFYKNKV